MKIRTHFFSISLCLIGLTGCNNNMDYVSNDPRSAQAGAPTCYDVNDSYSTYSAFFKPAKGWVGDPMPFYENGKFHIFYLHDARDGAPTFHPWYKATTENFSSFTDNGEMIPTEQSSNKIVHWEPEVYLNITEYIMHFIQGIMETLILVKKLC
uniref:hypothetical protein n=1 Tax=uncultured Dysgonomonas sp. TaxID=206096 RepID=UPI002614102D|nr:hypothetical protein [uncultured Dysgonomonas sp.]